MNGVTPEQVTEIFRQTYYLEDNDSKIMLLEEAVRLADICGDFSLQYDARDQLINAATFGGAPEKALVAYSWCLAQYDRRSADAQEGGVDLWRLLWMYKWILTNITSFPQISKAQIEEMLDDMAARYQRAGYSLRPNYMLRNRIYRFWDEQKAAYYFHKAQETYRDSASDCAACELDDAVSFALREHDDAEAARLAVPIIQGRLRCGSIPKITFADLLLPFLRLGRIDEAVSLHVQGYRLIARSAKGYISSVADHITFLVVTENFDRAVRIFEKHLTDASALADLASKFDYYLASWLLLDTLRERRVRAILKLRLPPTLEVYEESGTYETASLAAWFLEQAQALAARFDARNESDCFTRDIEKIAALKEMSVPCRIREAEGEYAAT
ncbi:MAG TPA: hypothetical protein VJ842_06600 [Pyrinomonadaceae bacterium]|nr:hypothetical protein [Pyrinomonadaceae bacterium]